MRIFIAADNELIIAGVGAILDNFECEWKGVVFFSQENLHSNIILHSSETLILYAPLLAPPVIELVRYLSEKVPMLQIVILGNVDDADGSETVISIGEHAAPHEIAARLGLQPKYLPKEKEADAFNLGNFSFTPREKEIAQLIIDGYTNVNISEKLGLSVHTVHTHRKNIMRKTKGSSFRELVRRIL